MSIMFAATSMNNVLGYVFIILMGRMLTPISFGTLVAVQALFDLIAVAASALRVLVAKEVSSFEARAQHDESIGS